MKEDTALRIVEVDEALHTACKREEKFFYLHSMRCLAGTAKILSAYPEKTKKINIWIWPRYKIKLKMFPI